MLQSILLTEDHVKEIASWRYDGDYALYNLPSFEVMEKEGYALCDPVKRQRFRGYLNEENRLIGFVNLLDDGASVFFGIGIHPNDCNQGYGKEIIKLAINESQILYPNKPLVLEVRTWNERAIRCYQSQGFKIIATKIQETHLGIGEFYEMSYNVCG